MTNAANGRLRMRDVCARTGLTRATIHHYIREGVLPKPAKTGRNTAYYDDDFIRRVQLVKTLQEKTHMPLATIRDTLAEVPDDAVETIDPDRFADVSRAIADNLRLATEREISRSELLRMTGLRSVDLDSLALARLIEPTRRKNGVWFSPLDVRIVLAFSRIRDAGATAERGFVGTPEIVRAYRHHLTEIARAEAEEMARMAGPLAEIDLDEFVNKTSESLGDLVAALHRKALVTAVTQMIENGRN